MVCRYPEEDVAGSLKKGIIKMSRKFKILRNFHDEGIKLYAKGTIEIKPGLTVLVGCNGAGKTTLLKQIESRLKKEKIPYVSFDNLHDGGSNARSEAAFMNDFEFVANSMCSSEGENIALNVGRFAYKIGALLKKCEGNEAWILMDAIDSGLSVDAVVDMKKGLFETILEHYSDKELYIVVSANEYELARGEKCFDVVNCKYVKIKDYEDYRNIILQSREIKDKRYDQEE